MNGLLLVNKPIGITSFDIIRTLRRASGVRKIGHAGTLDPMASGLMLLLFGSACKQAQTLSGLDKRYAAHITLGATSSTGDNEGDKLIVSARKPSDSEVESALAGFRGQIRQTPSMYSAIKINGQEAYKYARAGQAIEMPSRQVMVYESSVVRYAYPIIELNCRVSSGTYIRSLASDLGDALNTGAYLSGLVRTEVGNYRLGQALALDEFNAPVVIEQHLLDL
jgi:tRNA pseudouridine55 synthase